MLDKTRVQHIENTDEYWTKTVKSVDTDENPVPLKLPLKLLKSLERGLLLKCARKDLEKRVIF